MLGIKHVFRRHKASEKMRAVGLKDVLQLINAQGFSLQLLSHLFCCRGVLVILDLVIVINRPRLIQPAVLA